MSAINRTPLPSPQLGKDLFAQWQAHGYKALEEGLKPFISQLYDAEAVLLGDRYTQFTYSGKLQNIAVDKMLYVDGLNTGNTKEQMMLEFLLVLASQYQQEPFAEVQKDEFGRVNYIKRRQLLLRRILFNNPFLQSILSANSTLSSEARWEEWINLFINSNHYVPQPHKSRPDDDDDDADFDEYDDEYQSTALDKNTIKNFDPSRMRYYTREELAEIKDAFMGQNSFASFAQAIYLLRSWSLNIDDDKKWIYKFLFPFGHETLFIELSITAFGQSEYIKPSGNYMSGCGEVLFSMLQRACAIYPDTATSRNANQLDDQDSHTVAELLVKTFFPQNNPINDIAKALAGKRSAHERTQQQMLQQNLWNFAERSKQVKTFDEQDELKPDFAHATKVLNSHMLPVKSHEVFKKLAEDFANILKINLAVQDKFNALSTIGMLHIMVYLLRIGRHACALEPMQQKHPLESLGELWLYDDIEETAESIPWRNIDMVVAVKAATRSRLRQMSAQSLRRNQSLIADSLEPYARAQAHMLLGMINGALVVNDLSTQELLFVADVLKVFFACRSDINFLNSNQEDENIEATNLKEVLDILCQRMRENGSKTVDVHQSYARSVGLVPAQASETKSNNTTRNYYTLSDELVRHLVYAVFGTRKHMLFDDFLVALYQRYQLVIGPHQATQYYTIDRKDPNFIEKKEFADNADDFKEQLRRLDLLLSLSDGFDYVCNPYGS